MPPERRFLPSSENSNRYTRRSATRPFSSRAGRSDTHSTVSSRNCRPSRSQARAHAATARSRERMLSNHSHASRASATSAQASHISLFAFYS